MTEFKGYRGVRESVRGYSVTWRMRNDEGANIKQQHELTQKRCLLADTLRVGRCRSALPQQGSNIHFYLLVIAVWERQDGANTALETRKDLFSRSCLNFIMIRFSSERGFWKLTWHLSMSSWAPCPGSVCTATAPQTDSVLPWRCSPLSAAPHQIAIAQ